MQAVEAIIEEQPRNKITGELVGQYHLVKRPTIPIKPQGLVKGSRHNLQKTKNAIINKHGQNSIQIQAWENFDSELAPQTESVMDYLKSHKPAYPRFFDPLFVTLKDLDTRYVLPCEIDSITSRKRVREETILQVVATASVKTSSNPRYKLTNFSVNLKFNLKLFTY
jgi:hypothetical protein